MITAWFVGSQYLSLGFLLSNIVPCSSVTLGYVGLAVSIVALSYIAVIAAVPMYLGIYARLSSAVLPLSRILNVLLLVLVLPLLAGFLTRKLIEYRFRVEGVRTARPYLSVTTIFSMLTLVFLIVSLKAWTLIAMPQKVAIIMVLEAAVIITTLGLITFISRLMHLPYRKHVALVFPSTGKNQGMAAAVAVSAINPTSALVPAIWPILQLILLVTYLNLSSHVDKFLNKPQV